MLCQFICSELNENRWIYTGYILDKNVVVIATSSAVTEFLEIWTTMSSASARRCHRQSPVHLDELPDVYHKDFAGVWAVIAEHYDANSPKQISQ